MLELLQQFGQVESFLTRARTFSLHTSGGGGAGSRCTPAPSSRPGLSPFVSVDGVCTVLKDFFYSGEDLLPQCFLRKTSSDQWWCGYKSTRFTGAALGMTPTSSTSPLFLPLSLIGRIRVNFLALTRQDRVKFFIR